MTRRRAAMFVATLGFEACAANPTDATRPAPAPVVSVAELPPRPVPAVDAASSAISNAPSDAASPPAPPPAPMASFAPVPVVPVAMVQLVGPADPFGDRVRSAMEEVAGECMSTAPPPEPTQIAFSAVVGASPTRIVAAIVQGAVRSQDRAFAECIARGAHGRSFEHAGRAPPGGIVRVRESVVVSA